MRLVLNNFEELYQKNKENLLLGEWCDPEQNKDFKKVILKYHWENIEKSEKDFEYLDNLIFKIHEQLGEKLEKIHSTNFGSRYWNIILSPWVEFFITGVFDKWESIKNAEANYKFDDITIFNYKQKTIPSDYYEFSDLFKNEEWNHQIYADIVNFINNSKYKINFIDKDSISFFKYSHKPNFFKLIFDKLFSKIQRKNKVVFLDHYFGRSNYIKISLKLKQFPRIYHEFYKKIIFPKPDLNLRNKHKLNLKNNNFEEFISKFIFQNIPICFLEGYKIMQNNVLDIKLNPDLIITGNRDFVSDLARFWAAYHVTKNKKLILNEHGGGIPYKFMHYSINNLIFNDQITWVKNKNFNEKNLIEQKQLSAGRLINLNKIYYKKPNNIKDKNISLITLESYLHAKQCIALPSSLILKDFHQKKDFLNLLRNSRIEFKIKPFKNRGWNTHKKFENIFGSSSVSSSPIKKLIGQSKLIVCGYPETPLMEAIVSGVPTILLYTEKYWSFENDYQNLVNEMRNQKMVFSSAKDAYNHIKIIHENPYTWWNSKDILILRDRFQKECGGVSTNWIQEWSSYINKKLEIK